MANIDTPNQITRFRAFCYHLLFSLILTAVIIGLVVWLWYPLEFISATGVAKIFLLVIAVDACLGPFLTLIVYDQKKKKKELKRDLLVILIIQLSALAYGTYTLAKARTVYIVFAVDRFELVQANELVQKNLSKASEERFKRLPWFGPQWIATIIPDAPEARLQVSRDILAGSADIAQLPKYYRDISVVKTDIIERAKPLSKLKIDDIRMARINTSYAGRNIKYLPLTARKRDLSVIIDTSNGEVIDIVDVDPW